MLLFVVIQSCMFMSLLFHPRVLGWILTQLWRIMTFRRKKTLGELSIRGVYFFSLTVYGCSLKLSGVQLNIEWAGIRLKLREIVSPCEVWFDGVNVIEVKDKEREQLPTRCDPPRGKEKDNGEPPPQHNHPLSEEDSDQLFVLPGYAIWLLTTVKIAISHLVLETGDLKVDVTRTKFSANFVPKLSCIISVVQLDMIKFQDKAMDFYGTLTGFVFKSEIGMKRHVPHLLLHHNITAVKRWRTERMDYGPESFAMFTPMELTHIESVSMVLMSMRVRVVVRDDYPYISHKSSSPKQQSKVSSLKTSTSDIGANSHSGLLPLSSFTPQLLSVSISDVHLIVSPEHGTIPNLHLFMNSEPGGGESTPVIQGQWTLLMNKRVISDGMEEEAAPRAVVECDVSTVVAQCNDETLTFKNIRFEPSLDVHRKEGFDKFHVSPSLLKGNVKTVDGHIGQRLASWVGLHERWEVATHKKEGAAQIARLAAGLPPIISTKLPRSFVVKYVDIVLDEPKSVSSLYTIDTGGIPDEFQHHIRAFSIEVSHEVVIDPETRDRRVEINAHAKKAFTSLRKASEISLETYITSTNCELEISGHECSVKRIVKRKVTMKKSEVLMIVKANKVELTDRVHPIFERRLCQAEDMEFQNHKILMTPGGKYGEGVPLAKPSVEIDVTMSTMEAEWSGRTHVSFFRLIKRLPLSIDYVLGLPKDLFPSHLTQRVRVSRHLVAQVVPASVAEGDINGRSLSGCVELQVETSGFEFSMDNRIVVPLHSTPTLKNIYSVTVDDFTMLMLSNQQLRVKKDAAMADTSSLTAAAAISLLQGVNDTTVKAAAVEGKDKPNSFVPVLRALDLKVCQDFVDTEVKLDSLGFEISGNRKSNMSVTFSSIDVTLPPEVKLGDIGQDIAKQFKIAETLIPEKSKIITVQATNTKFDFHNIRLICKDKQRHHKAAASVLDPDANRLDERKWGTSSSSSIVSDYSISEIVMKDGVLAMAMERLEYEVHSNEPLDTIQSSIRSLDSHDNSNAMEYQNIQGGQTRLQISNYAAWVVGCSVPVVEFDSLCLTGVLLQASLSVYPYSHCYYQLWLSTSPGHPFHNYPFNSGMCIELDTMPQKTYMDVLLEMDGLEVVYGRCLEPGIDLAGKAFSRLQAYSDGKRKASIALCSSEKRDKTDVSSSSLLPSSPSRESPFKTSSKPLSKPTAWDNLRCQVHGGIRTNISNSAFTYLLAPVSQAENINLFDSVRIISESTILTYRLGHFNVDLARWVVSIPGVANKSNPQQQQPSGSGAMALLEMNEPEESLFEEGEEIPPKLQSKKEEPSKRMGKKAVYGPRHCAVFLPRVTIDIRVRWDCISGQPYWHHFSSDLDEIRQHAMMIQLKESVAGIEEKEKNLTQHDNELKNLPLLESYNDFRATGLHLDIELNTSSVSPLDVTEVVWLAIRMDALERMSLMDDYYDAAPGGRSSMSKSNTFSTSHVSGDTIGDGTTATTKGLYDSDISKNQSVTLSFNIKFVLQGFSMVAWRGVSHTSDGFLLSIQYFDACGICTDARYKVQARSHELFYLEARIGDSTVDLVNVSSILSDWESSFDSKKRLPYHQSSEEANAWQLVELLKKIDATARSQHVFSTTNILLHKGKLNETSMKSWSNSCLNEGPEEVVGRHFMQHQEQSHMSLDNFFHLLEERIVPGSFYQAECLRRSSRIISSISKADFDDDFGDTGEHVSRKTVDSGLKMKNVKFSGAARAVIIVDELHLLWTIPIRDAIVLLVGDILEQLARRRARLHRNINMDNMKRSTDLRGYSSNFPDLLMTTEETKSNSHFPVNPKPTTIDEEEFPLEDIVTCVESSMQESTFDMLQWLNEKSGNVETPVSIAETGTHLSHISPTPTNRVNITDNNEMNKSSSLRMLSQSGSQRGSDMPTSPCDGMSAPSVPSSTSSFTKVPYNSRGNATTRKKEVKDSIIDYEVQLLNPQVKLHGAKSSVILSVFRASAQAITLNTLVSTNHNEEGQATSRSRSPTIQRDYIISQVRGTGSKQTTPISHKVPPSQQDEEIGVGQTRLRSPVQHPKSLAMYQTSTTPTDNHTSFDTCLDDGRASSSTTVHTTATSTELPEHESPTPSMLNTSSNQAPTVLRQKSLNIRFKWAWVYALSETEATHGLSEWANEEECYDEDADVELSLNRSQRMGVLRKIIRRFNLTAEYQFYEPMSIDELRAIAKTGTKLPLRNVDERPCTKMLLDVPTLCLVVESEQLYQILDVVRNLLLTPPTQESLKRSQERSRRKKKKQIATVRAENRAGTGEVQLLSVNTAEPSMPQSGTGSGNQNSGKTHKNKAGLDVVNRHDRQTMRSGVENFLEAIHKGTLYPGGGVVEAVRVEYYIGRCICRLMMSPQYILSEGITDKVEVGMTGFGAKHSYMSIGNAAAVYQDVLMQVERFWINNLTPGPEACENFEDASSILGSVLPVQDTCQRCGIQFLPDQNQMKSCRFHGFEDGTQGCFILEQGFSGKHWTCCGDPHKDAPGCVTRPHVPKELMICVRAEGCPPVLVQDMDIHVFRHIEVNMFPSTSYSLVLQLTKGVATMLQRYFELDEDKDGLEDENEIFEPIRHTTASMGDPRGAAHDSIQQLPLEQQQHQSRLLKKKGKKDDEDGGTKQEKSSPDVIYLKYIRLGDINLNVSVQGFKYLSLDQYSVAVKPFVRWRKVGTGPRMLRKLIWHITRSVTSHVLKPNLFRATVDDESKQAGIRFLPTLPVRKKSPKKHNDKAKLNTSSGSSKDSRSSGFKIKRMFRRRSIN